MIAAAPILRAPALRAVEARHAQADPPLMERAGAAATAVAIKMLPPNATALVVAGPGNNGGDALVVARLLKEARRRPIVVLAGSPDKLPVDAKAAYEKWLGADGEILSDIPSRHFGLVVDGLFGIGLTRPVGGRHAELIARMNAMDCPVLALDVPSGIDSETGRVLGCAVRATQTATFIALKPGLLTLDGPDHCGAISLHTLDVGCEETDGVRIDRSLFRQHVAPRLRNTHKGSFGSVGILGGSTGMAGAALLAGRAALQLGAGRVYVGMLERLPCDPMQPELMLRTAEEVFALASVLAIGPGLGQTAAAAELLRRAIDVPLPLVVDADGLNLLATHPVFARHLARRETPVVLTPHPVEAARLLSASVADIQADRVDSALKLAAHFRADVVLKGCGSVIATADGRWAINTTGNAGLASAGSGDVLTGMVAALLAQAWPAEMALACGVHLHGTAADQLAADGCGPIGMTAGELIPVARRLLNRWTMDAAA
jgi:hydroxyethylthiazole kinase-like uncharacterized protein yjeF